MAESPSATTAVGPDPAAAAAAEAEPATTSRPAVSSVPPASATIRRRAEKEQRPRCHLPSWGGDLQSGGGVTGQYRSGRVIGPLLPDTLGRQTGRRWRPTPASRSRTPATTSSARGGAPPCPRSA